MLATGNELLELIPQRSPMVMVDQLLLSDNEKTVTGFNVDPANIFCEKGFLSESGLVENIAQTAAAGVGYVCKKENRPVPIGYIAAIKNLEIIKLPAVGANLQTEAVITNQILNVTIINGTIVSDGTVLAKCEMKIFIKN